MTKEKIPKREERVIVPAKRLGMDSHKKRYPCSPNDAIAYQIGKIAHMIKGQ